MTRYIVRRAHEGELDAVMDLFATRVQWLQQRHQSDQWSLYAHWRPRMAKKIAERETRVLWDRRNNTVCGTLSIGWKGDPEFWGQPDESEDRALYLSKLATHPHYSGQNLGRRLLDWAEGHAFQEGANVLRLDAWKSAAGLHRYYEQNGWTHLRTHPNELRNSGALFMKNVTATHFPGWVLSTSWSLAELEPTASTFPYWFDPSADTVPLHVVSRTSVSSG